jgi:DNA polymerase-4
VSFNMVLMEADEKRFVALVDLDAFYASVETLDDPTLAGKPLLIGGSPASRGVVAAASYEARKYGCHSAMPMSRAVKLCPTAIIISPHFPLYREHSQKVMDVLRRESALVQQMSIDEAYVDLTPVAGSIEEAEGLAHRMQGRIHLDLGLPASVGLASNKLVAKVACETGKPQGFVVVRHGDESAFLAELEVRALPGIGPQSAQKLRNSGFATLGQVADSPLHTIMAVLGPYGALIQRRARGEDSSPVSTDHDTKSVSAEETFAEDVTDPQTLTDEVARLAGRVAKSLSDHGLVARTVTLKLRNAEFFTITRSTSRERSTADVEAIAADALHLLHANWIDGDPVRLVGVGASNLRLVRAPGQLAMDI